MANKDNTAYCLGCDNRISFRTPPKLGQKITCAECESELVVIDLDPIELDWPFEDEDEGYDDLDDDYDL